MLIVMLLFVMATGNIVLKSIQGSNYMNKIVEIWLQNNLVSNFIVNHLLVS